MEPQRVSLQVSVFLGTDRLCLNTIIQLFQAIANSDLFADVDSDEDPPVPNPNDPIWERAMPGILTKTQLLTEIDLVRFLGDGFLLPILVFSTRLRPNLRQRGCVWVQKNVSESIKSALC